MFLAFWTPVFTDAGYLSLRLDAVSRQLIKMSDNVGRYLGREGDRTEEQATCNRNTKDFVALYVQPDFIILKFNMRVNL